MAPRLELGWNRCLEAVARLSDGVDEAEPPRMEHEAAGLLGGFARFTVNGITDEWGSLVMEMDADLVGAAGVKVAEDKCGEAGGVGGEDFVIGDRGFPTGWIDDCHFLAVHRVAADVGENGVLGGFRDTLGDGQIEFLHGAALGELSDERLVGDVGFRYDEAAGSILVQAVDDAGTLDPADAGELAPAMVKEGIHQGAVRISRCGVDDHAGGLVKDHEVRVLEKNIERDFLRLVMKGNGLGKDNSDFIPKLHLVSRPRGMAVDLDELFTDERLDT